jgi:hypothetical protein
MGLPFRAVIDGKGLPHAAAYYRAFPREPSPAGPLTVPPASIAALHDNLLSAVLDEMAKVAPGGTVLLVCHGALSGDGLILRTGSGRGGEGFLTADMERLLTAGEAEEEAGRIRKMPQHSPEEQSAKADAWSALLNKLQPGSVNGTVTVDEVSRHYRRWLQVVAESVGTNEAGLLALVKKMNAVRALRLGRVEIRACDAGRSPAMMRTLKRFFNCDRLLAPSDETFYLGPIPVDSADVTAMTPAWAQRERKGLSRVFKGGTFTLTIEELASFKYKGSGVAQGPDLPNPMGRRLHKLEPSWDAAKGFVDEFIMPGSTYKKGGFPVAGFWDPQNTMLPFVLPNEKYYLNRIHMM